MASRIITVYTVQTVHWEYNNEFTARDDWVFTSSDVGNTYEIAHFREGPVPVQSFLSRRKAEEHAAKLERGRREGVNPFEYGDVGGGLAEFSSLNPSAFAQRMLHLGVTPPELTRRGDLAEGLWNWWDGNCRNLPEDLRNAVWDALDAVRFYRVVPMRVEVEG